MQHFQTPISPKREAFYEIFVPFLQSRQNFAHFKGKDELHRLNISEVIKYEKCRYLNDRKLLFQNTLRESTCSRVPNIAQICTAALLS